ELINARRAQVPRDEAQAIDLEAEALQPDQNPNEQALLARHQPTEAPLRVCRFSVHAEDRRLQVGIARALVAMRMMRTMDVLEICVAHAGEQGVEHLPDA